MSNVPLTDARVLAGYTAHVAQAAGVTCERHIGIRSPSGLRKWRRDGVVHSQDTYFLEVLDGLYGADWSKLSGRGWGQDLNTEGGRPALGESSCTWKEARTASRVLIHDHLRLRGVDTESQPILPRKIVSAALVWPTWPAYMLSEEFSVSGSERHRSSMISRGESPLHSAD